MGAMPAPPPGYLPFPPSGITRNYGVDFFIYMTTDRPPIVIATNYDLGSSSQYQYLVSPSSGIIAYLDYVLGGAPQTSGVFWTDALSVAFLVDSAGNALGGAHILAG